MSDYEYEFQPYSIDWCDACGVQKNLNTLHVCPSKIAITITSGTNVNGKIDWFEWFDGGRS